MEAAKKEQRKRGEASDFSSHTVHLQSSPPYARLFAFSGPINEAPKKLLAKTSMIKNTGLVLEQMPQVISSIDAHMEYGMQSVAHLKPVSQLLTNIESFQLSHLCQVHLAQKR